MKTYEELVEELLIVVNLEKEEILKRNKIFKPIDIEIKQTPLKTSIHYVNNNINEEIQYKTKILIFSLSNEFGLYFDNNSNINERIKTLQLNIDKFIHNNRFLLEI